MQVQVKKRIKMLKLIRYDFVCGFKYNFKKYIVAVVFVILCCVLFMAQSAQCEEMFGGVSRTLMDYFVFFFKGSKEADFEMGSIGIPAVFLGIQIIVTSMVGYYPFDDIYGYGKQVFIRVEKKSKWWLSKCAWTFMTVLTFYVILYAVIVLFCLVTGQDMSFIYHDEIISYMDMMYIGSVTGENLILYMFVTPVIYSLMISMVQVTLSMIIGPILSFLAVMVYDILGILVISKGLMANYTMIFRDKMVSGADIEPLEGIIYMLIPMVICVFVGMAVIKRKEIFEK